MRGASAFDGGPEPGVSTGSREAGSVNGVHRPGASSRAVDGDREVTTGGRVGGAVVASASVSPVPPQRGTASVASVSPPIPARGAAAQYGHPEDLDDDFGASDGYSTGDFSAAAEESRPISRSVAMGYGSAQVGGPGAGDDFSPVEVGYGSPAANPYGRVSAAAGSAEERGHRRAPAAYGGASRAVNGSEGFPRGRAGAVNGYGGPEGDGYGRAVVGGHDDGDGYGRAVLGGHDGDGYGYGRAVGAGHGAGESGTYGRVAATGHGTGQDEDQEQAGGVYGRAAAVEDGQQTYGPGYRDGYGDGDGLQRDYDGGYGHHPTGGGYDGYGGGFLDAAGYGLDGGYDGPRVRSSGDPDYRARRHRPSANDTNVGTHAEFASYGGLPDERYVHRAGRRTR